MNSLHQAHEKTFPTLFRIAMDYLPVQASSVPCERIFSSSAETDTKKRNRIKPELMEALQILKFALKKERLHFTSGLLISETELLEISNKDDGAADPLAKMMTLNTNMFNSFLQFIMED